MGNNLKNEGTKKCPKCQEEIQINAKKCKHCNADLRSWFSRHPFWTACLLFIVLMMIVSVSSGGSDKTNQSSGNATASSEVVKKEITQAEIVSSKITKDSIGTPILNISIKNNSKKTIDAVDTESYFFNNYDEPIGKWGSKNEEAFNGGAQEKIAPNSVKSFQWNLAVYENATKVKNSRITRIHFTDGETVSAN